MHPEATVTSTPQATSRWKPTDFQRTEATPLITDCFLSCLFICEVNLRTHLLLIILHDSAAGYLFTCCQQLEKATCKGGYYSQVNTFIIRICMYFAVVFEPKRIQKYSCLFSSQSSTSHTKLQRCHCCCHSDPERFSFLLKKKNMEKIDQIDSVSLKSILNNKLNDKMLVHALQNDTWVF